MYRLVQYTDFHSLVSCLIHSTNTSNKVGALAYAVLIAACHLLPWVCHDWVNGVHELVEAKFVEEVVSLLSVSVEDGGFLPLEWFFVYSN